MIEVTGVRYLPVMISRIMLSLRKAVDKQQNGWSLAMTKGTGAGLEFFQPRSASSVREDGIPLHTYIESRTEDL